MIAATKNKPNIFFFLSSDAADVRQNLVSSEQKTSGMRSVSFCRSHRRVHSAAVAVIAAITFRDYGLGWDDYTHSQYGDLLLKLYGSGFADPRALSFVNLYKYGGGFDMAAALAAKVLPFGLFETRRLIGAAAGILGLFVDLAHRPPHRRTASRLIALVLLATCPLYYGHMFMNAKDAPFASAMAVLLLGLVRAFDEYPEPHARTWCWPASAWA